LDETESPPGCRYLETGEVVPAEDETRMTPELAAEVELAAYGNQVSTLAF